MPRASATPERRNARSRLPGLKNQPAGRPEAALLRSIRALDLRVEGYSYRAIGGALGVNAGTAYRDVERALAEALDRRDDVAERARTLELRRCDRYLRALAPKIAGGDEGAINTALRVGAVVSIAAAAGRTMSPVAAVVFMCASLTGSDPLVIARRVAGPLFAASAVTVLVAWLRGAEPRA